MKISEAWHSVKPIVNKEWHLKNKMPVKPTDLQRAKWHIAHSAKCSCRDMTPKIKELVNKYR